MRRFRKAAWLFARECVAGSDQSAIVAQWVNVGITLIILATGFTPALVEWVKGTWEHIDPRLCALMGFSTVLLIGGIRTAMLAVSVQTDQEAIEEIRGQLDDLQDAALRIEESPESDAYTLALDNVHAAVVEVLRKGQERNLVDPNLPLTDGYIRWENYTYWPRIHMYAQKKWAGIYPLEDLARVEEVGPFEGDPPGLPNLFVTIHDHSRGQMKNSTALLIRALRKNAIYAVPRKDRIKPLPIVVETSLFAKAFQPAKPLSPPQSSSPQS